MHFNMNKSIHQLKYLFEETITALSIAESLTIQTTDTYLEYAKQNNFDTVLIQTIDDELLCWDRFSDDKLKNLKHSEIVTDSTPLLEVVGLLVQKRRLFVQERNSIKYIVTLSDLEKMPVRIWLFGIISLTEMELKDLIDRFCPMNAFINSLTAGRKSKAMDLFNEKKKSNSEIKLIDCLQYCDIESIIKKTPVILNSFNANYKKSDFNILSDAEKLRNMLAHSQRLEIPWSKILDITTLLESLLDNIANEGE